MKKPPKNNTKNIDEDKELWQRVARTVKPLRDGSSKADSESFEHMMHVKLPPPPLASRTDKPVFTREDKKTRRGKVSIDGKIDLHDLTADQAFEALRRGLIRAYNRNKKCLLVVTGKGIRGQGVLRQSLPGWLGHQDIRHIITEYAPAHIRHGGSGAWYIFLKTK